LAKNRGKFDTCIVINQLVKTNSGMPEFTIQKLKSIHRKDAKDAKKDKGKIFKGKGRKTKDLRLWV